MHMDIATRILLVDDHPIFRSGLRALLSAEPDLSVVGEASNGHTAIELVVQFAPDIVIMDLRMPDLNGIDAARRAIAACPSVKVIGLSASADVKSAAEMLRAGAAGYVVKEMAYESLIGAIRQVLAGNVYFEPAVIGRITGRTADGAGWKSSVFQILSTREREVLQLISEGRATKQIATALRLSLKTVETHRRNIMTKLGIDSIAELTKYAIREGLTSV
jgi:DNA-binding NarL/FixJ family response regulator